MPQDTGASANADQALAVPVEPSGLDPSGFDPSREAAALSAEERRYLIATPLQQPADAGIIAYYAGIGSGNMFAGFARRQTWLFTRMQNCYGTAFDYRLSKDGALVRDAAIAMEARQGGDGETRPHPKDDSAGPKDIAHD